MNFCITSISVNSSLLNSGGTPKCRHILVHRPTKLVFRCSSVKSAEYIHI